ncbi:AMP-binding protein [Tenacibaculum sp. 190524A02b]|uniref:AMP-binding protein n=1 Tax=Tenacibaculum vairaonense TaxID=3137860 RepID=UPI0031FB0627
MKFIHASFKLNGKSFESIEDLLMFSKKLSEEVVSFLKAWYDVNDFVIVQTSGSTGKPKSIKLKKEYMVNSAKATGAFFELPEKTSALLCMSVNYIAGKMMLVRALTLGWHIDIKRAEANPLKNVEKKYDFCAMVPMQLAASLKELGKIEKLIVGGGVVSNDLYKQIQNKSTKIYATYGMTETITHIAVKKLNHFSLNKEVSYYQVLPNVNIALDKRNCLVINAPKVAKEKIVTNDVVVLKSETSFEWLGRYDNVINSGGVKLHPEKIEEKLALIIPSRFFVAGIKDEKLGEKLVLIVEKEMTEREKFMLEKEIEEANNFHKYEKPKQIFSVSKFVETETKKIQRNLTLKLLNL